MYSLDMFHEALRKQKVNLVWNMHCANGKRHSSFPVQVCLKWLLQICQVCFRGPIADTQSLIASSCANLTIAQYSKIPCSQQHQIEIWVKVYFQTRWNSTYTIYLKNVPEQFCATQGFNPPLHSISILTKLGFESTSTLNLLIPFRCTHRVSQRKCPSHLTSGYKATLVVIIARVGTGTQLVLQAYLCFQHAIFLRISRANVCHPAPQQW